MDIVIRATREQAVLLTAELIADTVRAKPGCVLGVPTGRTFIPVYEQLAELHCTGKLNFSGVTTFNLDEYIGLSPDDPNSFACYMGAHLFSRVDIRPDRRHLPNGNAEDLTEACRAYEQCIVESGGIDLMVLGIGLTGHIGFNEPGSSLHSRTRSKALSEITRKQNAEAFGGLDHVPYRAVTMGIGTILDARRTLLLATGASKAAVVANALEGPVSASVPASALQFHPHCTVILDEPAASALRNSEYYTAAYAREPEWTPYRERGF